MVGMKWLLALGWIASVLFSPRFPAVAQGIPPQGKSAKIYSGGVVRHIAQYRFHPDPRCRPGEPVRSAVATVGFSINRSGIVLDARIIKSSGNSDLDRAALVTIRSASPMPVPPDDLGGEQLHFVLPVNYRTRCQ